MAGDQLDDDSLAHLGDGVTQIQEQDLLLDVRREEGERDELRDARLRDTKGIRRLGMAAELPFHERVLDVMPEGKAAREGGAVPVRVG